MYRSKAAPHPLAHQSLGVFAPASPLRPDIVPKPIRSENPKQGGGGKPVNGKQRRYIPWAELLRRVFRIDVEKCSRCGAKVKVVAVINEHKIIERIPFLIFIRGTWKRLAGLIGPCQLIAK